jgi:ubiquinone/menaquinone biosynthesis C-methylase UbiE
METDDRKYYEYLVNRSRLSMILRKMMYRSLAKEFKGKLLDAGCGLGEMLELYRNSYGIDSNKYVVEYCKTKGLNCLVGSAYKIPFKDKTFDTVLCSHLIEHLKSPEKAFKEFRRVLKKNGRLIIIVPTMSGYKRDKTHVRFWVEKDLVNILKKFKFKTNKISYYPFKSGLLRDFYINELRVVAIKRQFK